LTARAYKMWETLSVTDFSAMARLFRDAIDLDPGNAKALAGLSLALIADKLMGNLNIQMAAASAKDALRRSLRLIRNHLKQRAQKRGSRSLQSAIGKAEAAIR